MVRREEGHFHYEFWFADRNTKKTQTQHHPWLTTLFSLIASPDCFFSYKNIFLSFLTNVTLDPTLTRERERERARAQEQKKKDNPSGQRAECQWVEIKQKK